MRASGKSNWNEFFISILYIFANCRYYFSQIVALDIFCRYIVYLFIRKSSSDKHLYLYIILVVNKCLYQNKNFNSKCVNCIINLSRWFLNFLVVEWNTWNAASNKEINENDLKKFQHVNLWFWPLPVKIKKKLFKVQTALWFFLYIEIFFCTHYFYTLHLQLPTMVGN